jgi:ankyrin repeat protein
LDRLLPLLNFDPSTLSQENAIEGGGATLEERARLARQSHSPEPASPSNVLTLPPPPSSQSTTILHAQKRPATTPKHQQARKKMKLVGISPEPIAFEDAFYEHHRSLLMSLFLSDNPDDTPSLLASALLTKDINIDLVIDEQGHTALHWAAALGRAKIVDLLIKNGANTCRVNYEGETPLMRAAMINCCYDNKCFTEMVEMMADSIPVTDKRGRTVLHHIALTATVEGYTDAAIYYMKRFVKAVPKKSIIKNILNVRDTQYYESALAIALRVECQDIVDILIKQGALVISCKKTS